MQIKAQNLSKTYNNKIIVDKVSLDIRTGQVLALLGPNGAGKSTTIKMLSGQIKPTSGEILVSDRSYKYLPENLRSKIGMMPQEIIIWEKLNIYENLHLAGTLQGLKGSFLKRQIQNLIEGLNLQKEVKTLGINLSGGYLRRLNLAISIIHNPDTIFLDEPSPGIDPQSRRFLWDFIANLRNSNKAIVLTDHYLEEAEALADYVVIIDNGQIIAADEMQALKNRYSTNSVLQVFFNQSLNPVLEAQLNSIFKTKYPDLAFQEDGFTMLTPNGVATLEEVMQISKSLSVQIQNANLKQPSLEDIFLFLTGRNIRE